MSENVKVKNAKKVEYDGIKFDSALEVFTYKQLKLLGVDFSYAGIVFEIIPALTLNKTIALWPNASGADKKTLKLRTSVQRKTYTPDFTFNYNGRFISIECKGFFNDDGPTKRKLYLEYLEQSGDNCVYLEPHSQRQVLECIEFIKNLE